MMSPIVREESSTGSGAESAGSEPEQAPVRADEPAAVAPDPRPAATDPPPAAAPAAPPAPAASAVPLAGLLRSSTVRLGVAGAAAVVVLGLVALSIGAGPLGSPPSTAGGPASTALSAPGQHRRRYAERQFKIVRQARRRASPPPDGEARHDARRNPQRACGDDAPRRGQGITGAAATERSPSGCDPQARGRQTSSRAVHALATGHIDAGAGHTCCDDRRAYRPHRCGQRTDAEPIV